MINLTAVGVITPKIAEALEWTSINLFSIAAIFWANNVDISLLPTLGEVITWGLSSLSIAAMVWFNIERALKMRKDRRTNKTTAPDEN